MKYRMGFVSNSSSSSFMGGIGIIADYEKFEKWKASLSSYLREEISIYSEDNLWDDINEYDNVISIGMPVNSEPEVNVSKEEVKKHLNDIPIEKQAKYKLLDNDFHNVVYFVIGGDEGDEAFMNYEINELNYDIDLDFFDRDEQKLYKEFGSEDSGIVCANKIFGADRNG